jgi:hypothetical protein
MPDGDRFEKTLFGRGWRKAYRLACDNQPYNIIGDILMKAVAAALRGPLACHAMGKVRDAVYQALKEKARGGQLDFGDRSLADPFRMLTDLVGDIVQEDANSVSAQLAAKAAKTVYLHLQRDCRDVTESQVQERLSREFGELIARHQFLARVREGVALKNGRTPEAQMEWETGLFSHLEEDFKKTVGQTYRTDRKPVVRAPRRRTPRRKMTIEELHKGIAVLEV